MLGNDMMVWDGATLTESEQVARARLGAGRSVSRTETLISEDVYDTVKKVGNSSAAEAAFKSSRTPDFCTLYGITT